VSIKVWKAKEALCFCRSRRSFWKLQEFRLKNFKAFLERRPYHRGITGRYTYALAVKLRKLLDDVIHQMYFQLKSVISLSSQYVCQQRLHCIVAV
jgi:hypothetical protein